MKPRSPARYERYAFAASPWVQKLTQRELAALLGTTKDRLEALIENKERWVSRRPQIINGKSRNLAIPTGRLRGVHEYLKFHLNKIKLPPYVFSPRKGRAQRDNAAEHAAQSQFLSLDIRQFYPSTLREHIFRWGFYSAGLSTDVAGMIAHLVAIDGKMPFGSPVSPILTALVHQEMFDEVNALCLANNLKMSLWVDDLTISGRFVRGELVEDIRAIIRKRGFQTHKVEFRDRGRPVIVTGVPIEGGKVVAPASVHQRVKNGYAALRVEQADYERAQVIDKLLSALGTLRYHVGASSAEGRQAANRMHALKQRRSRLSLSFVTQPSILVDHTEVAIAGGQEVPWE